MKNKKIAALLGLLLAGSMAFSLSGCGNSNSSVSNDKSSSSSSTATDDSSKDDSSSDDSAGFEEIQVDEKHSDQEVGPLTVNAVYFQPIDMEPSGMGLKAADASFHLEADIHANQKGTELGYGKGDFVPDLTVNYDIIDKTSNESVGSGTFMQMNASDGPHYGANVKLDKAGSYKLVLKIESPEKKGWMLHVDPETGVKGRFWTEPLEVTFPDWNYTPQEW
ncbi:iron transporter [Bifidobacterium dentium]|uniref:iron transporter n=1 Tax=Bifidobacterium dentium TaxID=1689 RepID=UPI0022E0E4DB|nr:iron transporter [Bifidobacterium dentium]